jgi:lambda family phage portal protein
VIVNNVIGSGVGMQGQVQTTRDGLAKRVNDDIEWAWLYWSRADACHTGGQLHFADLERAAMAEIVTAGEVLIRKHYRRFGSSKIPFALELIEAERLLDDTHAPIAGLNGNVRMGVELDEFQRPIAYYLRKKHPGDRRWQGNMPDEIIRVPAGEMFHLRLGDRWPQTRGEPWLHGVLRKLDDLDQYTQAEIQAARASAYYFGTIESTESNNPLATDLNDGSQPASMDIESGIIQQLAPGEKLNFHTPTRPNAALDAFVRHMLREMAAGLNVSYESLSRDYSQSNYSSSRLALLDDRDMWRTLQSWWVRSFREPLHREWMQAAVMSRAVTSIPVDAFAADTERYTAVLFKPRGWSWIDPTKEVEAYKEAVRAGFITVTDVIAQTGNGMDIEDVVATRRRELDLFKAADIDVDTTVEEPQEAPEPPEPEAPEDRSVHVNLSPTINVPERSISVEGARVSVPAPVVHMKSPSVLVESPVINVQPAEVRIEPAVIHVEPAVVNVPAPEVRVSVPAPVVNIEPAVVTVEAPAVTVEPAVINVAPAEVRVMNEQHDTEQLVETDPRGNVKRVLTRRVRA